MRRAAGLQPDVQTRMRRPAVRFLSFTNPSLLPPNVCGCRAYGSLECQFHRSLCRARWRHYTLSARARLLLDWGGLALSFVFPFTAPFFFSFFAVVICLICPFFDPTGRPPVLTPLPN